MSGLSKASDASVNNLVSSASGEHKSGHSKAPSLVEEKSKSPKWIETYDAKGDGSSGRKLNVSPKLTAMSLIATRDDSRNEVERPSDSELRPMRLETPPRGQVLVASRNEKEGEWQLDTPKTPVREDLEFKQPCERKTCAKTNSAPKLSPKEATKQYNPSPPNGVSFYVFIFLLDDTYWNLLNTLLFFRVKWPQRSPIKSSHCHIHYAASFNLFTNSFETLSDHGNYLNESAPHGEEYCSSPTKVLGSSGRPSKPPRKLDMVTGTHVDSDRFIGDISPIKLSNRTIFDEKNVDIPKTDQKLERNRELSVPSHHSNDTAALSTKDFRSDRGLPSLGSTLVGNIGGCGFGGTGVLGSNPFFILRSVKTAFRCCMYQLPCLYEAETCPVNLGRFSSIRHYRDGEADANDILTASRRVQTAIIAMGGQALHNCPSPKQPMSIFRHNGYRKTPSREFYEQRFHQRYYMNGYRVSWDMEENPPVHLGTRKSGNSRALGSNRGRNIDQDKSNSSSPGSAGSHLPPDIQQKTKYR